MGPYITFEGLSFTGKTTQAKLLVQELSRQGLPATYIKSCPTNDSLTGYLARQACSAPIPRWLKEQFFCANILWDNHNIGQALKSGVPIVQDRGLFSYLSFNEAYFNHNPRLLENHVLTKNRELMHEGTIVYLEASPEERLNRMRIRSQEKEPTEYEKDEIFGDASTKISAEFGTSIFVKLCNSSKAK